MSTSSLYPNGTDSRDEEQQSEMSLGRGLMRFLGVFSGVGGIFILL